MEANFDLSLLSGQHGQRVAVGDADHARESLRRGQGRGGEEERDEDNEGAFHPAIRAKRHGRRKPGIAVQGQRRHAYPRQSAHRVVIALDRPVGVTPRF